MGILDEDKRTIPHIRIIWKIPFSWSGTKKSKSYVFRESSFDYEYIIVLMWFVKSVLYV